MKKHSMWSEHVEIVFTAHFIRVRAKLLKPDLLRATHLL